jgi:predicted transcriptional regulator
MPIYVDQIPYTPLAWLKRWKTLAAKEVINDNHIDECIKYMEELETKIEDLKGKVSDLEGQLDEAFDEIEDSGPRQASVNMSVGTVEPGSTVTGLKLGRL